MWIPSLFQTGMRQLFILGLVSALVACDGGGSGKKPDPAPASSSATSSSLSSSSSSSSISSSSSSSLSSSSSSSSVTPVDTTPNAFSFNTVTGAPLNLSVTSTTITISGINTATPVSITGGEYSIAGGAFTSAAGTITNGQTLAVRLVSAVTSWTETQARITVGGIAQSFSVTTLRSGPLNIAGVVTTLAGRRTDADGIGAAAKFNAPQGAIFAGSYLYVADSGNNKIRKIALATGVVTTLAGSGSSGSADGTGAAASFGYPQGLTTDGTYLYVADTYNDKIRKIAIATGDVTTLAGSGSYGSADGTGAAASFYEPSGITSDGTYLYVADTGNNAIRKIEIATGVVTSLAGSGSYDSADGTGAAASFANPQGITTDGTYLYVADTWNYKIRTLEISTGVVTTLAGSGSWGNWNGVGSSASFAVPMGITTDGTNLYVTDFFNNQIRKIVLDTGVVTSLAGSVFSGSVNGVGTAASFRNPQGITTDGFSLFVADTNNNTIRKIE